MSNKWRVVNTDNFGGDYPDEKFEGPVFDSEGKARNYAYDLNQGMHDYSTRYRKVVKLPYKLLPGFEA